MAGEMKDVMMPDRCIIIVIAPSPNRRENCIGVDMNVEYIETVGGGLNKSTIIGSGTKNMK